MSNDGTIERPIEPGQRERLLAETFVGLADTLIGDFDIVELLDRLVAACLDLVGVSAAGLILDDQRGHLAVLASSSEELRFLEMFEVQNNEGPCLDCLHTGAMVESTNLLEESRWPRFSPHASEAGFLSVVAVPLRLRDQTIGALNMFESNPRPMPLMDQKLAQALADVATIGILQQRSIHRSTRLAEQLQHALNSRIVIEQAKGVVAERTGSSIAKAFDILRRIARDSNLKLTDVALAVIAGELDPTTYAG